MKKNLYKLKKGVALTLAIIMSVGANVSVFAEENIYEVYQNVQTGKSDNVQVKLFNFTKERVDGAVNVLPDEKGTNSVL